MRTLGSDRASSKGYIVRWVEDNICTYRYGEILHASAVLLKLFMSDRDYVDDFVVTFQYKSDAVWFYEHLKHRMGHFGLSLEEEKSRLIEFGRYVS